MGASPIAYFRSGQGHNVQGNPDESGADVVNSRGARSVAATLLSRGKGRIAAVYGPVGLGYARAHHPVVREVIGNIVRRVFPDPLVRVEGPPCVDISLRYTREDKLSLHLMNLASVQRGESYLNPDFAPAVGPIEVSMRVSREPTSVYWVPGRQPLDWKWEEGLLSVTAPSFEIHGVVVID